MGIVILVVVGAILGWLSSIVQKVSGRNRILELVLVGMATTLATGLLTYSGSLLTGISGVALAVAMVAAMAVLTLFVLLRDRAIG